MIPSPHLTDDQLIERLYCASLSRAGEDAHFDACPECRDRARDLDRARARSVPESIPPPDYFDRQRREILARIAAPVERRILGSVWVPASLAVVLAAGLAIARWTLPEPSLDSAANSMNGTELIEILEPGWFEDTYSAMSMAEPRAASPIRGLFAEAPLSE